MKLHELLAVEGNLETQAAKCSNDLKDTFEKRRHHFEKKIVKFTPLAEGAQTKIEAQSEIQTSVVKELAWIAGHIQKSIDASYQVAEANTLARADIVLEDGTVLAPQVPATALLELEKRVADWQKLLAAIPTLDPTKGFRLDPSAEAGTYIAREIEKTRTQKIKDVIILYPATKEHPAQTQLLDKDVPVGVIVEQEWSSLITPAEKADLLDRVENLARAVRRARSRANEQEIAKDAKLGSKLLNFVFKGK